MTPTPPFAPQGSPVFRSGMAQPRPPQQQGAPYGQPFSYTEYLGAGMPASQRQAWEQAGSPKYTPTPARPEAVQSRPGVAGGPWTLPAAGLSPPPMTAARPAPAYGAPGAALPATSASGQPGTYEDFVQAYDSGAGLSNNVWNLRRQSSLPPPPQQVWERIERPFQLQQQGIADVDMDGIDDRQQQAPAGFQQPAGISAPVMRRAPTGQTWESYSAQFPGWASLESQREAELGARQRRRQETEDRIRYMQAQAASVFQAHGLPNPHASPRESSSSQAPQYNAADYYRADGTYDSAAARAGWRADHASRISGQNNQQWLRSMTPANRRVYGLMQAY